MKTLKTIGIFLTMAFICFSCEKEKSQLPDKTKLLLGSWSYTVGTSCRDNSVLTFEPNGIYLDKNEGRCLGWNPDPIQGTWRLDEDQNSIIFKVQNSEFRKKIVSLTHRELILRIDSGTETKYTR